MGGPSPSPEIWRSQNIRISARFRTTSRLDRAYLRNATIHRQLENDVANYGTPAEANLIWCTLVHKWRKIGPEFWPTQLAAIRLGRQRIYNYWHFTFHSGGACSNNSLKRSGWYRQDGTIASKATVPSRPQRSQGCYPKPQNTNLTLSNPNPNPDRIPNRVNGKHFMKNKQKNMVEAGIRTPCLRSS